MNKKLNLVLFSSVLVCAFQSLSFAQYDPPAGYYATATGTGATLQSQLNSIIDGHVIRSYGNARDALQILDRDPNNASRIILIYNGVSVVGTWDSGATWNREHQWPRSRGVGTSGADNTDLHHLRPCNPSVNSSRGNQPFGIGGGLWDPQALAPPGVNDRGDCARTMFYMAVRYDGADVNTVNLGLVNGFPGTNQMGDLNRLLEWHYSDPVDDIELRRNHLIWSSADNPLYFQGNRNPFIDHPEFAWSIFGSTANDSTLYFGMSVPPDGASIEAADLRFIVGAPSSAQSFTLNKVGSAPTTYDVIVAGDVSSPSEGTGLAFIAGTQSVLIDMDAPSTATVGSFAGTISIDNTDITSAAAGEGVSDLNDVVNVSVEVMDSSNASFDVATDQDALTIDFGTVTAGSGLQNLPFEVNNLQALSGFTALLDIDSINATGDSAVLFTDVVATGGLQAGDAFMFTATLDSDVSAGAYSAVYTFNVSDEDIPGGLAGTPLVLTLTANIFPAGGIPTASEWGLVVMTLSLLIVGTVVFGRRVAASASAKRA